MMLAIEQFQHVHLSDGLDGLGVVEKSVRTLRARSQFMRVNEEGLFDENWVYNIELTKSRFLPFNSLTLMSAYMVKASRA